MQLAVLSSQGPPVSLPSLKKHFLLRNISNNYPIAVHYNHNPCKQQTTKTFTKKAGSLADNVGKFLLRTLFGFVFFTDLTFTIVLLEYI